MLQLLKKVGAERWHTQCPYCDSMMAFVAISPIFCSRCSQELPRYSILEASQDERKDFYQYGLDGEEEGLVIYV